MTDLSFKFRYPIAAALALFMIVTRSPVIPAPELLHTGSWAVFFAAGVYLDTAIALPAFLALAFVIDALALGWGGVSSYCLTPAYAMLIPAYGCLWAAGRWYAHRYRFAWSTLLPLAISAVVSALACEAFASGGFYWLSGRFADPALAEFVLREGQYFPAYLATLVFWIGVAATVHVGVVTARGRDRLAGDALS